MLAGTDCVAGEVTADYIFVSQLWWIGSQRSDFIPYFPGQRYKMADWLQALVQAHSNPEQNRDLLTNIFGIIFLGTPHKGVEYSRYAQEMTLHLNRLGSNPDIFVSLETNSDSLRKLHQLFITSFKSLHMVNFFETRKLETKLIPLTLLPLRIMVSGHRK